MNFSLFKEQLTYEYWVDHDESKEVQLDQNTKITFEMDDYDTINILVNIVCENGDVYQPFSVDHVDMHDDNLLAILYKMLVINLEYVLQRQIVKHKENIDGLQSIILGMVE